MTRAILTTGVAYLRSLFAGGGSASYVPSGAIHVSTVQAGTIADLLETVLWTYTLPANTLNADGKGVRVTLWGTTGADANNKTIAVYFAGTSLRSLTTGLNGGTWRITATILRTGASAQLAVADITPTGVAPGISTTTPAGDTTTGLIIKVTGQNGTAVANDVVFRGAIVEVIP